MTQNIYDDPDFLAGYSTLPRSVEGLDGAPEWPTLRAMLPDLAGSRVADLGCGFGWFSKWAAEQGAAGVLALDVSEKMLARASADNAHQAITYERQDLEQLALRSDPFGLIYSSLTFHYIADLAGLFATVRRSLTTDGSFVFSVEHPMFTAPAEPGFVNTEASTTPVWPLTNYLIEGERTTNWFADGVRKQHRTLERYVTLLLEAGFVVTHLCEWGPTDAQVAEHPEWESARHCPPFLLIGCRPDARAVLSN